VTRPTASAAAFTLKLGTPVPELVPREVHDLHRWLARELLGLGQRTRIEFLPERDTLYLTFDQIRDRPELISEVLNKQLGTQTPDVVLLDLSVNPYDLLREPLLLHIAEFAVDAASVGRAVAILLPAFPPEGVSLFWERLVATDMTGTIVVLANNGENKIIGRLTSRLIHGFDNRWKGRRDHMREDARDRMRAHVFRRIGHFRVPMPSGDHCSRYVYDASLAVQELALLTEERARTLISESDLHETTLAIHSGTSPWLTSVAALVAPSLEIKFVNVTNMSRRQIRAELRGRQALLFTDFVNTGTTIRGVAARLRDHGVTLHSEALAAMGVFKDRTYLELNLRVHCIHPVVSPHQPANLCPQCKIGYPYMPLDNDRNEPLTIRSYDMWDVVFRGEWKPETYGPSSRKRLDLIPDLKKAFADYGDWLAYKLDHALSHFGFDSELVVVAPDEPAVLKLIERLRTRYEERLVVVGLPREALDAAAVGDLELRTFLRSLEDDEPAWARQLRHAALRDLRVVLIDEFNESGRTALAMTHIVEAMEARCGIYVPIFNRSPGMKIEGVTAFPLYEFPASQDAA
jgi:adenine/guanine phosphoribosyltransferase-like PRPP-binding protein